MKEPDLPFADYVVGPVLGKTVSSTSLWISRDLIPKPRDIQIGYSKSTNLISLTRTLRPMALRRSHIWIKLNEPESHLESIADIVQTSGVLPKRFTAIGLTRKDHPLLTLLAERGCNVANDSALEKDTDDIICHQEAMSLLTDRSLASGQILDLVVARHILEHTFDMANFLRNIKNVLHPEGCVLFEVPDASISIDCLNYSELWEEHIHYFTKSSLERVLIRLGWEVVFLESGLTDGERILVCLARPILSENMLKTVEPNALTDIELATSELFCTSIGVARRIAARQVSEAGASRLVFVGANHCTSTMIDLVCPSAIDIAIVDDDKRKQGLYTTRRGIQVQDLADVTLKVDDLVLVSINPTRAEAATARIKQIRTPRGPMMFTFQWGVD